MRPIVKIVLPLLLLLGATVATVAAADPIPPTTPYPGPVNDSPQCPRAAGAVTAAQAAYDLAARGYDLAKRSYEAGGGSYFAMLDAETALHLAGIALNEKKYAELICRNDRGKADKCVKLALQLNQMIDELPMRSRIESIANEEYLLIKQAYDLGAAGEIELAKAKAATDAAVAERKGVDDEIKALRDQIKNQNPPCKDTERPARMPTSAPSPVPTSSSTVPTSQVPTSAPVPPTEPTMSATIAPAPTGFVMR